MALPKMKTLSFIILTIFFTACGGSDSTDEDTTPDTGSAPSAPTNVTVTAAGDSQLDVTWNDNSAVEEGFRIYYSTDDSQTGADTLEVNADTTEASLTGLSDETTYYIFVTAFSDNGESSAAEGEGTTDAAPETIPTAPTGLSIAVLSDSALRLFWTDNTSGQAGHRIYRATSNSKPSASTTTTIAGATSADLTGLTASTQYFVWVEAVNSAGSSNDVTGNETTVAAASYPLIEITGGTGTDYIFTNTAETSGTNDPTLTLTDGVRYQIRNDVSVSHPFAFLQSGVSVLGQGGSGVLASDTDILWFEDGDSMYFTVSSSFESVVTAYDCQVHASMTGAVIVP